MTIPANDNHLWKGFSGHGLYAKRAEKDRNGEDIVTTYAKKTEVPVLTDDLTTSTDTAVTPNAVNEAINNIVHIPDTANQPSTLYVGGQGMGWTGWESEDIDIPNHLPDHCVLLDYLIDGYHLGQQPHPDYIHNYPSDTGYAPNDDSKSGFTYFDFTGAPFDKMPYAHFNNTTGTYAATERLLWTGLNKTNYPDGLTVEFLAKVDTGATICQFVEMINAYNFAGISYNSSTVGSYQVINTSATFIASIGRLSAILSNYNTADAWHHYCYTADFKNNLAHFFLDGILVSTVYNNLTGGMDLGFMPCCINTYDVTKLRYGYCLAQVAVWDYPKYTSSFTISRKPLIAL